MTAPVRVEALAHRAGNRRRIVTDRGASDDRHADLRELPRDVGGIGVDGEAQQQLIADRHDLDAEATARGAHGAGGRRRHRADGAPALARKIEPYRRRYRASE